MRCWDAPPAFQSCVRGCSRRPTDGWNHDAPPEARTGKVHTSSIRFAADLTPGLSANMRYMTRILLVPILLVPILCVWPQRGITAKFYPNTYWVRPARVRVERQINLDFITADSASL